MSDSWNVSSSFELHLSVSLFWWRDSGPFVAMAARTTYHFHLGAFSLEYKGSPSFWPFLFHFSVSMFFFPLYLQIHVILTSSSACPPVLPSRAQTPFNTFSINLGLFHQANKGVLASWGVLWQKTFNLKALQSNFTHCCINADFDGGSVGFTHVLWGSESSLMECGTSASQSICNVHMSVQRKESVITNPKANLKPEFFHTCQCCSAFKKRRRRRRNTFLARCVCCWLWLLLWTPASGWCLVYDDEPKAFTS